MSSEVKANKLSPATGTDVVLGDSGDTFTIPSGGTITNSGTATGFGEDNTPAFSAYTSAATTTISTATETKITLDTEEFDSDGAFDSTTNYRFTVPAGEGGKYLFSAGISYSMTTNVDGAELRLKKNGAIIADAVYTTHAATNWAKFLASGTWSLDLSATDYVELYGYVVSAYTPLDYLGHATTHKTWLSGFKLAGV
jgi:hypothetical protein